MALVGIMQIGMSGMKAQTNRLAAAADNVANAGTPGHQRVSIQTTSMVLPNTPGHHIPGGVKTNIFQALPQQEGVAENGEPQVLGNSNVDLATEMTDAMEAEHLYAANAQVLHTGSKLLGLLLDLKK